MTYVPDFGRFGPDLPPASPAPARSTRIVLLGDFSGRAHRGQVRGSDELARLKPIRLDVDTLDRVIAGFATTLLLPVGADASTVEVHAQSLDDLHPDALFDLPVFAELAQLRQRLSHPATARAAADEIRSWVAGGADQVAASRPRARRARGNSLRVDASLGDFARLLERPAGEPACASPLDRLLRAAVAPHLIDSGVPDAQALQAAIDRALSSTMRAVLHSPDLQCLEAAWRSLDFIARRVETHASLQVVLHDISAEEFAADLGSAACLEDTGLYRLLVEQAALDAQQGPPSAIVADYRFEMTPPHAELLGRIAQVAERANAPFIAAIGGDALATRTEDLHPMIVEAWDALRALPSAAWLALTVPRFLLRAPYGERSDPVDCFEFEEFDAHDGLKTLLWGNAAVLVAVLLARHADAAGRLTTPGRILSVADMPYFVYTDADGDAVPLPCTERLLNERQAAQAQGRGFLPVVSIKGRPEVRLGGFRAVAGTALAGPWVAPAPAGPARASAGEISAARREEADDEGPVPGTATAEAASGSGDPALDALLAGLSDGDTDTSGAASDGGIDPDLEALLKEL